VEFYIKRIFVRKTAQGFRAFILALVSLGLFFADSRYHYFDNLRLKVSYVVIPLQELVNWPVRLMDVVKGGVTTKKSILEENAALRKELLLAKSKLQRLKFLEYENKQLYELFGVAKQFKDKSIVAELLESVVDRSSHFVTIDKGKKDDVYVGQPVLDADGLVGKVVNVEPKVSKILLITNSKSAIPVMITRNGLQAIAIGTDEYDYLELANIPQTSDVKVGDYLVTSMSGEHFSNGYPVGTVKKVKRISGERFLKVVVIPKANIDRNLHVLLVWTKSVDQTGDVNRSKKAGHKDKRGQK
jgi:rod shape-determining protein MreC